MAAVKFHTLSISEVSPQTDHGVALTFSVPSSHARTFAFTPGQYLTLRATIDGRDTRRSYSICSSTADPLALEVGIKQVDNGVFSNFAKTLKKGDTLQVMPPQGRFTAELGGTHHYLLIAAGSGVTPCLSIAKSVLEAEPQSIVELIYSNRSIASMMFRAELNALKDQHMTRFSLTHLLTAERQEGALFNGRIDAEKIQRLAQQQLITPQRYDKIYVCGPQQMTQTAAAALQSLGVDENNIASELFTTDSSAVQKPKTIDPRPTNHETTARLQSNGVDVAIILDGSEKTIQVDGERETVLEAAVSAGLDLPFSCAGGMCCTCRCKIVSGSASMDQNYSLQKWEIEAGFTLACQSRPTSEKLVLDFDAS